MGNILTRSKKKQAEALLQSNRLREAKEIYLQVCQTDANDVDAWFVLGGINGLLGDFRAAENCCRKVIGLRPNLPEAHFNLGMALKDQGRLEEAADSFHQAIRLKPHYAEAHNALGYAQTMMGMQEKAMESYREAVRLKPNFPEALNNLGNLLRDCNILEEAITCYQRALAIMPSYVDALVNLASAYADSGRLEDAVAYFRRALMYRPDYAEVHYFLGNTLRGLDRLDEALESFRKAQLARPGYADALGAEALVLQKQGRHDEAYARLQPAIEAGTRNPTVAVAFTDISKRYKRQDDAAALIENILSKKEKLPDEDKLKLHFALGKLYDARGDYRAAFEQYRLANSHYRTRFNRDAHKQLVDQLMAVYGRTAMARYPRATIRSERPVFIVGMPRSGTSLAEQILASHPSVYGAGELNDINQAVMNLPSALNSRENYPLCIVGLTASIVDRISQAYLTRLDSFSTTAARVTDKMPHNFLHLGLIELLFPEARIIHCRREPLDICLSIYFQQFGAHHAYANDLGDLGFYYRQYDRLMRFWRETLTLPIFDFCYEDVVSEPERHIRDLVSFCGLKWDDNCLRFYDTRRTVNTPSSEQVREPIYRRSVGRWKHYATFLDPLVRALNEDI